MKKLALFLFTLIFSLSLCSCSFTDLVIASLPNYTEKEFYTSGGIQDYTDYAKYFYDSIPLHKLESSRYFTEVSTEDVAEILLYVEHFEGWVQEIGRELQENYDFERSFISEGDFFYIKTKAGQPIGNDTYDKFDNYTVYYFDLDAQTLYYFHNNI